MHTTEYIFSTIIKYTYHRNYWWLRGFDSTHSEAPFRGPRPKERIEQGQIGEKSEKAKEVSENLTDKTDSLAVQILCKLSGWVRWVEWLNECLYFATISGEQRKAKNTHQCEWSVFTRGAFAHFPIALKPKVMIAATSETMQQTCRALYLFCCHVKGLAYPARLCLQRIWRGTILSYHNVNISNGSNHLSTLQLVRQ